MELCIVVSCLPQSTLIVITIAREMLLSRFSGIRYREREDNELMTAVVRKFATRVLFVIIRDNCHV
jgi:hypothetical protein